MMRRRALAAAVCLMLTSMMLVADPLAPAADAEVTSEQQAFWGLQTKGASETVARWDALGWAIEQIGGTMYVGGNFLEATNGANTVDQPYLAAFDADGGRFQSWFTPDVGGAIFSLEASPDGGLFVGGEVKTWNGSTIGSLAKIDPVTGELWPGWTTRVYGGSSTIRDIKVEDDGYLYVVGNFTTASHAGNPQTVSGAVRMDPSTGVIDADWKPLATGGSVWGVSRSKTNGLIYLAGHFDYINGQTGTGGFVGLDDDGTVVVDRTPVPLNNCANIGYCMEMYDVQTTDAGTVWVGGVEHALYVLDEANDYDLILHHFTNCAQNYSDSCQRRGGEYQEIELAADGSIYAACHCWNDHMSHTSMIPWSNFPIGTYTGEISAFAKYDPASGQRDQGFNPFMSGRSGGFGIHVNSDDGCVWVTGGINSIGEIGNEAPGRGLARLCDPADANNNTAPVTPTAAPCTVAIDGATATVSWAAVEGAVSHGIFRAVDGGGPVKLADTPDLSYSDTIDPGKTHAYSIRTKFLANQTSTTVDCDGGDGAGVPIGGEVTPVSAPASCTPEIVDDSINVSWPAVDGADEYVVYRSIDGGADFWRGKVAGTSFTDTRKRNTTLTYRVLAVSGAGVRSEKTTCAPDLNDVETPLAGPAECSAKVIDDSNIKIEWPSVDRAVSYVVHRSIDGGTDHWRGKTESTEMLDSRKPGSALVYKVRAVGEDGSRSPQTTCSEVVDTPIVVDAPASCSVALVDSTVTVEWTAVDSARDYIVRRQVDGGRSHWRGKVPAGTTSFTDNANRAGSYTYSVESISRDGATSPGTQCAPTVVVE